MISQTHPVAAESCRGSDVLEKPRRSWRLGILSAAVLIVVSGLVLAAFNWNYSSRLELTAQQIQIGSDWKRHCDENKDLLENWIFCVSSGPNSAEEYFYGGKSSRLLTELGWSLPDWRLINRFSGNLHIRSQCPVSIVVDKNGNGKVVGVRVRETWRGRPLSSAVNISASQ